MRIVVLFCLPCHSVYTLQRAFITFYSKLKTKIKSHLNRVISRVSYLQLISDFPLCCVLSNQTPSRPSSSSKRSTQSHKHTQRYFQSFQTDFPQEDSASPPKLTSITFRFETTVHRCTVPVEYTTTHNPYNLGQTHTHKEPNNNKLF